MTNALGPLRRLVCLAIVLAPLAGCLASAAPTAHAGARGAAFTPDPRALAAPDVSGTWYVTPGDGSPGQVWEVHAIGNTVTGTIRPDGGALAIAPRPLHGRLVSEGGIWIGLMDSPPGRWHLDQSGDRFAFCLGEGALNCARGSRTRPDPVPSPLSTTYTTVIGPRPGASAGVGPSRPPASPGALASATPR